MKRIYVIAIAFLASVITANENVDQNQFEQFIRKAEFYNCNGWNCKDGILTVCPFPEKNEHNTTTNLPHETDCTKFYKCFLGKGVLQDCPLMNKGDPYTRLHYNRREQVCDWPWQAGCAYCPNKDDHGYYPRSKIPNGDDCDTYYECINGKPELRRCSRGCFSRTCQECVEDRAGGNCGIPQGECDEGDRKIHECDCMKYYQCQNDEWFEQDCPGGLHYDPRTKECDEPDRVNCKLEGDKK